MVKMGLNLACGRRVKKTTEEMNWTNVDSYERENKLDIICDLTKEFPFENDGYDYIYAEQFIEHLDWLDGRKFLRNCYNSLKKGGILRLVFPDYKKIFQKYLEGDKEYFEVFFKGLNEGDYPYYHEVYTNPDKVRKERRNNPPPSWHLSPRIEDRERLIIRVRYYESLIEIVDWFVHQYFEHKCLYDFELIENILKRIGFSEVKQTDLIKGFDSEAPTRVTSSIFIEAIK